MPSIRVVWKSIPVRKPVTRSDRSLAGQQMIDADHQQRGDRAHDRQPDRGGQAEQAMVEIAERGRQHDQDRCCVERAEGGGGHVGFLSGSEVLMPVLFGCRNRAGVNGPDFVACPASRR